MSVRSFLAKLGLVGILVAGVGNVDAGEIKITNRTSSTGSVGISTLTAKNISGGTEGYATSNDVDFLSSPYANALEIYTMVEGHKLSIDSRPITTSGWDVLLGVKGNVTNIDNYLRYRVVDTTDLTGKIISAYDVTNPSVKYTLLQDGAYHNINLPNLTHGPGQYAQWRVDLLNPVHTLTIGVKRQIGGAGHSWVDGNRNLTITYGETGASDLRTDTTDNEIWGIDRYGNGNTALNEFGVVSRDGSVLRQDYNYTMRLGIPGRVQGDDAVGFDRVLSKDSKLETSTLSNIIEVYQHWLDEGNPGSYVYAETDPWKLVLSTDDRNFFKDFILDQRAPWYADVDSRYPSPVTLDSLLDANGSGEFQFLAQGSKFPGNPGIEVDFVNGAAALFDLRKPETGAYEYAGWQAIIEPGAWGVAHAETPEPATLSLLALGGIGLAGAGMRRKK